MQLREGDRKGIHEIRRARCNLLKIVIGYCKIDNVISFDAASSIISTIESTGLFYNVKKTFYLGFGMIREAQSRLESMSKKRNSILVNAEINNKTSHLVYNAEASATEKTQESLVKSPAESKTNAEDLLKQKAAKTIEEINPELETKIFSNTTIEPTKSCAESSDTGMPQAESGALTADIVVSHKSQALVSMRCDFLILLILYCAGIELSGK